MTRHEGGRLLVSPVRDTQGPCVADYPELCRVQEGRIRAAVDHTPQRVYQRDPRKRRERRSIGTCRVGRGKQRCCDGLSALQVKWTPESLRADAWVTLQAFLPYARKATSIAEAESARATLERLRASKANAQERLDTAEQLRKRSRDEMVMADARYKDNQRSCEEAKTLSERVGVVTVLPDAVVHALRQRLKSLSAERRRLECECQRVQKEALRLYNRLVFEVRTAEQIIPYFEEVAGLEQYKKSFVRIKAAMKATQKLLTKGIENRVW